jgi:hypothetical protein
MDTPVVRRPVLSNDTRHHLDMITMRNTLTTHRSRVLQLAGIDLDNPRSSKER